METTVKGFPMVRTESGKLCYGGDQEWYGSFWAREAGCAAVSAAALSAFYTIGIKHQEEYTKGEYLQVMNEMYQIMTPGINGYPDPYQYRDAFTHYAFCHGRRFRGVVTQKWNDSIIPKQFIRSSISANQPLALLVLEHEWQEFSENFWHWMTVIGFDEEKEQIILANYGDKECWDWNMLLKPAEGNEVSLVSFLEF